MDEHVGLWIDSIRNGKRINLWLVVVSYPVTAVRSHRSVHAAFPQPGLSTCCHSSAQWYLLFNISRGPGHSF